MLSLRLYHCVRKLSFLLEREGLISCVPRGLKWGNSLWQGVVCSRLYYLLYLKLASSACLTCDLQVSKERGHTPRFSGDTRCGLVASMLLIAKFGQYCKMKLVCRPQQLSFLILTTVLLGLTALTGMKISFVFQRRQKKLDAFITRNAGACLRTETADIRMAYGAAYPKTSTSSYIEVSSAGSTAGGGGNSNIHCNSKIVGKNWLWLCCKEH